LAPAWRSGGEGAACAGLEFWAGCGVADDWGSDPFAKACDNAPMDMTAINLTTIRMELPFSAAHGGLANLIFN
jgi:hypothetical protein